VRIALFDYRVTANNPIGGCHRRMLEGLSADHQFTVFAVEFSNPEPERIEWVKIPAPMRPLALLFVVFHVLAPLYYLAYRWRKRVRFDLVQCVEGNLAFGDVRYVHFCHKRYLKSHWKSSRPAGLRGWGRWLDYKLHALAEAWVFRRSGRVVTPSLGLAQELLEEYPFLEGRIDVVSNPVEIDRLHRPSDFDRAAHRKQLGLNDDDCVLAFVALGHFERKSLPAILEALAEIREPNLKLIVVGGTDSQVGPYRSKAEATGIAAQVLFCGMQSDIRPFLWLSNGFILPSHYETFSLVAYEAAAAELPLIVSRVHGVAEIAADHENALIVEPNRESIVAALREFAGMSDASRGQMGSRAREAVLGFGPEAFVSAWTRFYECTSPV
jgi:glycosyltransferase involved in cell wall biosynthesis